MPATAIEHFVVVSSEGVKLFCSLACPDDVADPEDPGDPAQEAQGLNSVFSTDTTTLQIIRAEVTRMAKLRE